MKEITSVLICKFDLEIRFVLTPHGVKGVVFRGKMRDREHVHQPERLS